MNGYTTLTILVTNNQYEKLDSISTLYRRIHLAEAGAAELHEYQSAEKRTASISKCASENILSLNNLENLEQLLQRSLSVLIMKRLKREYENEK